MAIFKINDFQKKTFRNFNVLVFLKTYRYRTLTGTDQSIRLSFRPFAYRILRKEKRKLINQFRKIFIPSVYMKLWPYNVLYPGHVRRYPGVYPGLTYIPASPAEGGNAYYCVHTGDLLVL